MAECEILRNAWISMNGDLISAPPAIGCIDQNVTIADPNTGTIQILYTHKMLNIDCGSQRDCMGLFQNLWEAFLTLSNSI